MKIFVKTKPSAKCESVEKGEDSKHIAVSVRAPAEDGKANRAVERTIAKHFSVPVSCVSIISGHTSRQKVVEVKQAIS